MDCSLLGSPVHGILLGRILEGAAVSFSRGSSWPGDQTWVSCIGRQILYQLSTRETLKGPHAMIKWDLFQEFQGDSVSANQSSNKYFFKKDYMPWPGGIYPRNTRLVQNPLMRYNLVTEQSLKITRTSQEMQKKRYLKNPMNIHDKILKKILKK